MAFCDGDGKEIKNLNADRYSLHSVILLIGRMWVCATVQTPNARGT